MTMRLLYNLLRSCTSKLVVHDNVLATRIFSGCRNGSTFKERNKNHVKTASKENEFAVKVLELTKPELRFVMLGSQTSDKDMQYLKSMTRKIDTLSFHEYLSLIGPLYSLKMGKNPLDPEIKLLLDAMNKHAIKESKTWTIDQILTAGILVHGLETKYEFMFSFVRFSAFHLKDHISLMTVKQFLQYMYLVKITRSFPDMELDVFEDKVDKCIEVCSVDEMCLILMALFRSRKVLSSKHTMNKIMDRVKENAGSLTDIQLSSVLKFLKLHQYEFTSAQLFNFQSFFEKCFQSFNTYNCVHMLVVGQCSRRYNRVVQKYCVRKLLDEVDTLRLKDLEKLIQCLSFTNCPIFEMVDVVELYENELRKETRKSEIETYPHTFTDILFRLALFKPLSDDFLQKVLEPEFIKDAISAGNPRTELDVFNIAVISMIEKPDFRGPMPRQSFLNQVRKKWILDSGKGVVRAVEDLKRIHQAIEGSTICHVLPNDAVPDILFCETVDGRRVAVPKEYSEQKLLIRKPVDPNLKWKVLVLGTFYKYTPDSRERVAAFTCRLRLLEKLGYEPIEVPHWTWLPLSRLSNPEFQEAIENLVK